MNSSSEQPTKNIIVQQPSNPYPAPANDWQSLALTAIASGGIVGGIIKKWGSSVISTKEKRDTLEISEKQLELETEKAQKQAALDENAQKSKIISDTLNLALSNIFQGSREQKEIYYALLEKYTILEKDYEILVKEQQRQSATLQDIFKILKMKERENA
jgi:hypothetical protein